IRVVREVLARELLELVLAPELGVLEPEIGRLGHGAGVYAAWWGSLDGQPGWAGPTGGSEQETSQATPIGVIHLEEDREAGVDAAGNTRREGPNDLPAERSNTAVVPHPTEERGGNRGTIQHDQTPRRGDGRCGRGRDRRVRRSRADAGRRLESPRGTVDRGRPAGGQHGPVRVREPRRTEDGDDRQQIHPVRRARRGPELLPVRHRRPLRRA